MTLKTVTEMVKVDSIKIEPRPKALPAICIWIGFYYYYFHLTAVLPGEAGSDGSLRSSSSTFSGVEPMWLVERVFMGKMYLNGIITAKSLKKTFMFKKHVFACRGLERAGLVPWVGGPPDASLGFYLREACESQTNTEKIVYNKSR